MNDFDYENLQKKRLARNAKYKKNGCKSKKCSLPGDYLTPAQKAKLSKTTVSVNLKAPISWGEFKLLPSEIKREYLEWLVSEFGATRKWVAEDLFGITINGFQRHIEDHEPSFVGLFPMRGRHPKGARERWLDFVHGVTPSQDEQIDEEPVETEPEPPAPQEAPDTITRPVRIDGGSFTVTGPAQDALRMLKHLFKDDDRVGTFTILFQYLKEENNG